MEGMYKILYFSFTPTNTHYFNAGQLTAKFDGIRILMFLAPPNFSLKPCWILIILFLYLNVLSVLSAAPVKIKRSYLEVHKCVYCKGVCMFGRLFGRAVYSIYIRPAYQLIDQIMLHRKIVRHRVMDHRVKRERLFVGLKNTVSFPTCLDHISCAIYVRVNVYIICWS